ncbi:MAG: hypothetical protein KKH01_02955 [Firmicutes bacterium]|nr:hypothetical protein [Bacillota bacterium]
MLCEQCGKKVKTKRNIMNLFDPEIHHICETCYMQNPFVPRHQIIPIEDAIIIHHSMTIGVSHLKGTAYMSMMKPYYIDFVHHYHDYVFIYFDLIDQEVFNELDSLKLGNIYLLSLYENIEKGEKL